MSPIYEPDIPNGGIIWYAGATAPVGWLALDGTAVSRTDYPALFGIMATTYGVGDGSTTFNLPDVRGRSFVGLGTHVDVDAIGDADANAVANRRPNAPTGTPSSTTNFTVLLGGGAAGNAAHTHTPNASWMTMLPIVRAG